MTHKPNLNAYVNALRHDQPSVGDEARLHRKLASAGIGASAALASKLATGAQVGKAGFVSAFWSKFTHLSLIAQLGVATATTSAVITAPVWVVAHAKRSAVTRSSATDVAATHPWQAIQAPAPAIDSAPPPILVPSAPRSTHESSPLVIATPRSLPEPATARDLSVNALAQETLLIDNALSAIRRGDFTLAEQQLDEHEARFPTARLGHERERARQKLEQARRNALR